MDGRVYGEEGRRNGLGDDERLDDWDGGWEVIEATSETGGEGTMDGLGKVNAASAFEACESGESYLHGDELLDDCLGVVERVRA